VANGNVGEVNVDYGDGIISIRVMTFTDLGDAHGPPETVGFPIGEPYQKGIGAATHETAHNLGWHHTPIPPPGKNPGEDPWSQLSPISPKIGPKYLPQWYKMNAGWLPSSVISEIPDDGEPHEVTLDYVTGPFAAGHSQITLIPFAGNEFYTIEARQNDNRFDLVPATGAVIYHHRDEGHPGTLGEPDETKRPLRIVDLQSSGVLEHAYLDVVGEQFENEPNGVIVTLAGISSSSITLEVENNAAMCTTNGNAGGASTSNQVSPANVGTTNNLSNNEGNSLNQAMAASGNTIHVVWVDDSPNPNNSDEFNDIFYRRSIDSGETFEAVRNLSNTDDFSEDPNVAASGNFVYLVWNESSDNIPDQDFVDTEIVLRRSIDGGQTFEPIQNLAQDNTSGSDPVVIASGNTVHVAWNDRDSRDIKYIKSIDNGQTFSNAIILTSLLPDEGLSIYPPRIAHFGSDLYVAWLGINVLDPEFNSEGDEEIFVAVSNNSGDSFHSVVNVSDDSSELFLNIWDMEVAGNNVFFTWAPALTSSDRNVFFRASNDSGATFNDSIPITTDDESWSPQLAVTETIQITVVGDSVSAQETVNYTIHLIWKGIGNFITYAKSADNGLTFGSSKIISETRVIGEPNIVSSGENLFLISLDRFANELWFKWSIDSGETFSFSETINEESGNNHQVPIVTTVGDKIFLSWTDFISVGFDVFFNVGSLPTFDSNTFVQITSRDAIRFGAPANIQFMVGNNGGADTYDLLLTVTIPAGLDVSLEDVDIPEVAGIDYSAIPLGSVSGDERLIPIYIYDLPRFSSKTFSLSFTAPFEPGQIPISANLYQLESSDFVNTGDFQFGDQSLATKSITAVYSFLEEFNPGVMSAGEFGGEFPTWFETNQNEIGLVPYCYLAPAAVADILGVTLSTDTISLLCDPVGQGDVSGVGISSIILNEPDPLTQSLFGYNHCGPGNNGEDPTNVFDELCEQHDSCYDALGSNTVQDSLWSVILDQGSAEQNQCDMTFCEGIKQLDDFYRLECGMEEVFCEDSNLGSQSFNQVSTTVEVSLELVGAIDPNEKAGPAGVGPEGFIHQKQKLLYTIFFENLPEATASALEVVITDQLDSDLNWSTFNHLESSHPDVLTVDANPNTGLITWTFTDIDLPPNVNPPEGEGYVTYTVKPNQNLPEGTEIRNDASIVFDFNPPIETNEVLNTIDSEAPISSVTELDEMYSDPSFMLDWSGDDSGGSGVRDYSVFVREDDGLFVPWMEHTTETSGMYIGDWGNKYSIYSISRDRIGNIEKNPSEPDTTTMILPFEAPTHCNGKLLTDFDFVYIGTPGNDKFVGTPGLSEVAFGLGGDDKLIMRDGDDCAFGGPGDDRIRGGRGNDFLDGQYGMDNVSGQAADDTVNGGDDADELRGRTGKDTVNGGAGDDTVIGNNGKDILNGDAGDDDITGGKGNDTMDGGAGTDDCSGGSHTTGDTAVNCETVSGVP